MLTRWFHFARGFFVGPKSLRARSTCAFRPPGVTVQARTVIGGNFIPRIGAPQLVLGPIMNMILGSTLPASAHGEFEAVQFFGFPSVNATGHII